MIRIRKWLFAATALTLAASFLTAPQARADDCSSIQDPVTRELARRNGFCTSQPQQQTVQIWTVPVWYAAPGQQYAVYGTYFVYVYPDGTTDNSEPQGVGAALSQAGYYWYFNDSEATFWRTGTR